jgi:hypothetical protein
MYGVSVILAPLLLTISSFFWVDGEYGVVGERSWSCQWSSESPLLCFCRFGKG